MVVLFLTTDLLLSLILSVAIFASLLWFIFTRATIKRRPRPHKPFIMKLIGVSSTGKSTLLQLSIKRTRELVLKKLKLAYPDPADSAKVLTILETYQSDNEDAKIRMHLAVLKLSGKNFEKLAAWIRLANEDFRDVISPAEYPEECKNYGKQSSDLDAIRRRDFQQYEGWLLSDEVTEFVVKAIHEYGPEDC